MLWVGLGGCSINVTPVTPVGGIETEVVQTEPFDRVVADGAVEVSISTAPVHEVRVSDGVRADVVEGVLTVTSVTLGRDLAMAAQLQAPSVHTVAGFGSGSMTIDRLAGSACVIEQAGSGSILVEVIACDALQVLGRGSGRIALGTGTVRALEVSLTGSGDARLDTIVAKDASIWVAGSGTAFVQVTDRLDARASGSGDILWKGSAKPRIHTTGSGEVRKR